MTDRTIELVSFLDAVGVALIITLIPFFTKELEVGAVGFGMITSLYGLCQIVGGSAISWLSEKGFSRKKILLLSSVGSCLSYAMLLIRGSLLSLVLSRMLVGFVKQTTTSCKVRVSGDHPMVGTRHDEREPRLQSLFLFGCRAPHGFLCMSFDGFQRRSVPFFYRGLRNSMIVRSRSPFLSFSLSLNPLSFSFASRTRALLRLCIARALRSPRSRSRPSSRVSSSTATSASFCLPCRAV